MTVPDMDGAEMTGEGPLVKGDVKVVFKTAAGIMNPTVDGKYGVMVNTDATGDTIAVASDADDALVISDRVYDVTLKHLPESTSDAARITVTFTPLENLVARLDTITIQFADDVKVPSPLDAEHITVTGTIDPASNPNDDTTDGVPGLNSPRDVVVVKVGTPPDEPEITITVPDHGPGHRWQPKHPHG